MPIPSEITIFLQKATEEFEGTSLAEEEEDDVLRHWVVVDEEGVNKSLGRRRASTNTILEDSEIPGPPGCFPSRWDCSTDTVNSRAIPSPRLPRRQGSKADRVIVSSETSKVKTGDLFLSDPEKNNSRGAGPSTGLLQSPTASSSTSSSPPRFPQRTWYVDLVGVKAG